LNEDPVAKSNEDEACAASVVVEEVAESAPQRSREEENMTVEEMEDDAFLSSDVREKVAGAATSDAAKGENLSGARDACELGEKQIVLGGVVKSADCGALAECSSEDDAGDVGSAQLVGLVFDCSKDVSHDARAVAVREGLAEEDSTTQAKEEAEAKAKEADDGEDVPLVDAVVTTSPGEPRHDPLCEESSAVATAAEDADDHAAGSTPRRGVGGCPSDVLETIGVDEDAPSVSTLDEHAGSLEEDAILSDNVQVFFFFRISTFKHIYMAWPPNVARLQIANQ
jgi:hypothetical protein